MFKYGCPSAVVLVSEGAKYPSVFRTIYTQDMTKGLLRKKCPSVFSGPYFPVFSPNTGKYEPEKATYLDTFHAVGIIQ